MLPVKFLIAPGHFSKSLSGIGENDLRCLEGSFLKVKELIPLFVKIAEELSGKMYQSSGTEFLCSCAENTLLDANSTLGEYHIKNGDRFILL